MRQERTRQNKSSKDIAGELGFSDSLYRLIEAGTASLNPARSLRLIAALPESRLELTKLSKYLVAASIVDHDMLNSPPKRSAQEAVEELMVDSEFEILVDRLRPYFTLREGTQQQKTFLEEIAAPEVGDFLRSTTYGAVKRQAFLEMLEREFKDMPTLNVDLLLDMKRSMGYRPFLHTGAIACRWEKENSPKFLSVKGLFTTPEDIVSESNLEKFNYDYLSNDRFDSLRFIFVRAHGNHEIQLKDRFILFLNRYRRSKLTAEEKNKITFLCLSPKEQESHEDTIARLRYGRDPFNQELEDFWSLKTDSHIDISFVGRKGRDHHDVVNLSFEDSLNRCSMFDILWDNVTKNSRS